MITDSVLLFYFSPQIANILPGCGKKKKKKKGGEGGGGRIATTIVSSMLTLLMFWNTLCLEKIVLVGLNQGFIPKFICLAFLGVT